MTKKTKGAKNESDSEEYDDVSSIASSKISIGTVGSDNSYRNNSPKFSSPQEKAFRKNILSELESKESKALEAKISDAIKANRPRIAFDPGGNSLTGVTDQYEYIEDCNNNVIDKKLKVFKVNTKYYYHEAKIKLAKRIVDQHWQEWEHKVKDMELQTHKVNSTVALMKYINFYASRTLFDTPNIDRLIDFYMDNKLSNWQDFFTVRHFVVLVFSNF